MNKSKFKIDTEFVLELQYKYSSLLEELHLRRNEVDKIQKSFRDEAQKKQKEFENEKESIIYDLENARKMVERQRKSIKQLKENEVIAQEFYEFKDFKDLNYISIYSQDGRFMEDLSYKIWEKEKSKKIRVIAL